MSKITKVEEPSDELLTSKRKPEETNELEDENLSKKSKNDTDNSTTPSNRFVKEIGVSLANNKQTKFDPNLLEKDPDCFECKQVYRDPTRKDLIMYLHALSYKVS